MRSVHSLPRAENVRFFLKYQGNRVLKKVDESPGPSATVLGGAENTGDYQGIAPILPQVYAKKISGSLFFLSSSACWSAFNHTASLGASYP